MKPVRFESFDNLHERPEKLSFLIFSDAPRAFGSEICFPFFVR